MVDRTEIIGKCFGKLTIQRLSDRKVKGHIAVVTICDCGNTHETTWNALATGRTWRCSVCSRVGRGLVHKKYPTKLYSHEHRSYRSMLNRCYDENHPSFDNYGGSGITVEEESWLYENGFENFVDDMGARPEGHTLDRIDNNKGYSKSNCRWATSTVQNHNKGKRCDALTSEYIGVSLHKTSWVVQIMKDGDKIRMMFNSEHDAAVAYDNFSEKWYGDRPNGTERYEPEEKLRKRGGITQDKRYGSWRVRYTTPDKKRVELGSYKTFEEAEEALETYKESTKQ